MHIKIVDYNNLDVIKNKALHCIVDRVYFNYIKERNRYSSESIDLNSGLNIDTELGIVYTSYPIDIFKLVNEIFILAPDIKIFAVFELSNDYYESDGEIRSDYQLFFGLFHNYECSNFIFNCDFNKLLIPKLAEYYKFLEINNHESDNFIPIHFNEFEVIDETIKKLHNLHYSSKSIQISLFEMLDVGYYFWDFNDDYADIIESIKDYQWLYPKYDLENNDGFKNVNLFSEDFKLNHHDIKWFKQRKKYENEFTIIIDTETNGLPKDYNEKFPYFGYPYPVQISWAVFDKFNNLVEYKDYIIKQYGPISKESMLIHGINNEIVKKDGLEISIVLEELFDSLSYCQEIVGHNLEFDVKVLESAYYSAFSEFDYDLKIGFLTSMNLNHYCTMKESMKHLNNANIYKYPKLAELYEFIFKESAIGLHNSSRDIYYTHEIYTWLKENVL